MNTEHPTAFVVYKEADFEDYISQAGLDFYIKAVELHKTTPKGWRLQTPTMHSKPFFYSADKYVLFDTMAEAAEYVGVQATEAITAFQTKMEELKTIQQQCAAHMREGQTK